MSEPAWREFNIEGLARTVEGREPRFNEFLRTATLSGAVYLLPAGAEDIQAPHLEDEVYLVVSGRARLRIAGQERDVMAGHIFYVRATTEHTFFRIDEDLKLVASSEHHTL